MKIAGILKSLIYNLYLSIKRFPVAIGFAWATTILLIILTHNEQYFSSDTRDVLSRIIMTLAFGIPLSLCIKLIFERKSKNTAAIIATYIVEAVLLLLYYLFLLRNFDMVPVTRYIALSLAFYLAFLYIPYYYRRYGFELYVIKLFTRFVTTAIYSLVLFLGMSAILFTIDKLLGIPVSGKLYMDIWLAVVGIFATSFFLAGVPSISSQEFKNHDYSKLLKVLLLYIVMPIIAVYTAILYIYFIKLLFNLQWPVGLVGHLVLWYSVISTIVIFLISPIELENKWVKNFIFWLSKLILPLIILMFVSMGIRVKAYGITENRYFVMLLGLWVFGIMIYLSLSKARRNIIMLITLSLIAVLSVIGPWSSYSVSKYSQNQRLESILLRNNMISGNNIAKSSAVVSDIDKREISQILQYFSESHELTDVKYLPKDFKMEEMEKTFGFKSGDYNTGYQNDSYFFYGAETRDKPVDIKGYDQLFTIRSYGSPITQLDGKLEVKYENKSGNIAIHSNGNQIYKHTLMELTKQLYQKFGKADIQNISLEEASFIDENELVKVKFIVYNLSGSKDNSNDELKIDTAEFLVLIHFK